jgi:hypothetical protein
MSLLSGGNGLKDRSSRCEQKCTPLRRPVMALHRTYALGLGSSARGSGRVRLAVARLEPPIPADPVAPLGRLADVHDVRLGDPVFPQLLDRDRPRALRGRGRLGFVGREAPADISALYVDKPVSDEYRKPGAANPIKYTSTG